MRFQIVLLVCLILPLACDQPVGECVDAATVASDGSPDASSPPGSIEEMLRQVMGARRSTDYFQPFGSGPITVDDVKAIAWASQGITLPGAATHWPGVTGLRTTPSAGATYPIELYIVAEHVTGLAQGAYRYRPENDSLESTGATGPLAAQIAQIRIDESPSSQPRVFSEAAAIFIIASVYQRTSAKYGDWAELYVPLEAGHVGQNLLLMATARGLAHRPWGALGSQAREQLASYLRFSEDTPESGASAPSCYQPTSTKAKHWPLYFFGVGQRP